MPPSAHRRALFAVAATVGGLLGMEALARGLVSVRPSLAEVQVSKPDRRQVGLMGSDPDLLWRMAPGRRQDGGADVRINPWGLRGPEPQPERPEVADVLVLGDSSIFG